MKRNYILAVAVAIFCSSPLISQDIQSLDRKHGFNIFTLGEDLSKYKDQLELIISDEEEQVGIYKYKKQVYFGVPIKGR